MTSSRRTRRHTLPPRLAAVAVDAVRPPLQVEVCIVLARGACMCACMCVLFWLGVLVCGRANVSEHSLRRLYMQCDLRVGVAVYVCMHCVCNDVCAFAGSSVAPQDMITYYVALESRLAWQIFRSPPPLWCTVGRGATIATAYRGRGRGAGRGTVGGVARAVRSGTARAPFKPQGGNGSTGFSTKVRAVGTNWILQPS